VTDSIPQPKRELLVRETQDRSAVTKKRHQVTVGLEFFAYESGVLVEYRRSVPKFNP
jgi:hypothetical protein